MLKGKVVLFAEDPGAVNVVAPLKAAFAVAGAETVILAAGSAVTILRQLGIEASSYSESPQYLEAFRSAQPSLLVVGTSANRRSVGLDLIQHAREARVLAVGVVDAWMNAELRFKGSSLKDLEFAPDLILTTDVCTREEFVRIGYPRDRLVVCGRPFCGPCPEQDLDRAALKAEYLGRDWTTVLCFLAEPMDGLGVGRVDADQAVRWFLQAASGVPHACKLLRMHPRSDPMDLNWSLGAFDVVSRDGPVSPWLWVSDVVVGMRTTALLEAAMLARKTLSLCLGDDRQLKAVFAGSGTMFARTADDCRAAILRLAREAPVALPTRSDLERITLNYTTKAVAACFAALADAGSAI